MVFAELTHLPPSKPIDHVILIKSGEGPVRVRPYQYAYSKKKMGDREASGGDDDCQYHSTKFKPLLKFSDINEKKRWKLEVLRGLLCLK